MSGPERSSAIPPATNPPNAKQPATPTAAPSSAPDKSSAPPPSSSSPPPLTPEEQMALYEKDLQENDWGHQPC